MTPKHRFDAPELTSPPADAVRPPHVDAAPPAPAPPPPPDPLLAELEAPPSWAPRPGRRTLREKLVAALGGLKHAVRGDSSFFAHAYRGLLIALAAALLGVGPMQWCLLVMAAALVVVAELGHSAVDTLARALGDPEADGPRAAREIAAAGVLVAVIAYAAVSLTVLTLKLGELLGWWS